MQGHLKQLVPFFWQVVTLLLHKMQVYYHDFPLLKCKPSTHADKATNMLLHCSPPVMQQLNSNRTFLFWGQLCGRRLYRIRLFNHPLEEAGHLSGKLLQPCQLHLSHKAIQSNLSVMQPQKMYTPVSNKQIKYSSLLCSLCFFFFVLIVQTLLWMQEADFFAVPIQTKFHKKNTIPYPAT